MNKVQTSHKVSFEYSLFFSPPISNQVHQSKPFIGGQTETNGNTQTNKNKWINWFFLFVMKIIVWGEFIGLENRASWHKKSLALYTEYEPQGKSKITCLKSSIRPWTKLRKLLCLVIADSGSSAMLPNTCDGRTPNGCMWRKGRH